MLENEFRESESRRPSLATIRQGLEVGEKYLAGRGIESARLDAELLLCMVVECRKERLYLDHERPLGEHEEQLFQRLLQRRGRREPISYITGRKEFWSRDFFVSPNVLVPRPETELLVDVSLKVLGESSEKGPVKILELGTGSGVIAVSLSKEWSEAEIWATDISREALKISATNATRHGIRDKLRFLQGDLFEPVKERAGLFHLIVSNPPYVRRGEFANLSSEVREWEPRLALDGGADGLDFYRRIISEAPLYLANGGFLALEMGADMARDLLGLIGQVGAYSETCIYQDYAGQDRVVVARKR
jgi:release factor glutamine methyltransferase